MIWTSFLSQKDRLKRSEGTEQNGLQEMQPQARNLEIARAQGKRATVPTAGKEEGKEYRSRVDSLASLYCKAWTISCCMMSMMAMGSAALDMGRPTTT